MHVLDNIMLVPHVLPYSKMHAQFCLATRGDKVTCKQRVLKYFNAKGKEITSSQ